MFNKSNFDDNKSVDLNKYTVSLNGNTLSSTFTNIVVEFNLYLNI